MPPYIDDIVWVVGAFSLAFYVLGVATSVTVWLTLRFWGVL